MKLDRERQILHGITCMWTLEKSLTHGNRAEMWLQRVGGNRERFVKGYKLSFIR